MENQVKMLAILGIVLFSLGVALPSSAVNSVSPAELESCVGGTCFIDMHCHNTAVVCPTRCSLVAGQRCKASSTESCTDTQPLPGSCGSGANGSPSCAGDC